MKQFKPLLLTLFSLTLLIGCATTSSPSEPLQPTPPVVEEKPKKTLDLKNYLKIVYQGANGLATAKVHIDEEEAVKHLIRIGMDEESAQQLVKSVTATLDKSEALLNDDQIKITISASEDLLKKNSFALESDHIFVVSGLHEAVVQAKDLYKDVEVVSNETGGLVVINKTKDPSKKVITYEAKEVSPGKVVLEAKVPETIKVDGGAKVSDPVPVLKEPTKEPEAGDKDYDQIMSLLERMYNQQISSKRPGFMEGLVGYGDTGEFISIGKILRWAIADLNDSEVFYLIEHEINTTKGVFKRVATTSITKKNTLNKIGLRYKNEWGYDRLYQEIPKEYQKYGFIGWR